MKKILQYMVIITMLIPCLVMAQTGKPYDININGVKVIVQPSGNEIVVIQTIIKGGVQNYAENKAGIENLAVRALTECGTIKDDKNSFKDKLDKVSAQVSGWSGMDYASVSMNCIKNDLDKVWPLYTDALRTPRFDEKEFDRIKQDAITFIRTNESFPDNAIDKMAKETAFKGKNYAKDPLGTIASVQPITAVEAKKYWQSIFTRSRMTVVIVGDLERSEIENKLADFFAKIPAGSPFVFKKENYTPVVNTFNSKSRDNATNYIRGITGGPSAGSPDYNAFILAMRIFSTRHFVEIRSKNGLSYAPWAWFSQGTTPYSTISVSTTEPNKYIATARALIDKVKQEGFKDSELKNEKTGYLTEVYYRQETNEAQASALANAEVLFGDWRRAVTIKDDIKKVSLDQMNNAFKKYINNITWVYQGDIKKVDPKMYTQKQTPNLPEEKKAF
ncbi:M16 family metallopeptidase [Terrimonas pollutisoli]|uniref:M16 family metallopeptidase n=1 Tax=Terrimonas pollutisoli TaxID=3034147 RepID=UPI0023ED78D5|nr:pitrilysin family protein [Terrimonas sp. H1YJ31]